MSLGDGNMNEENWVARWESHCGVAPRLTRFFSSEPARRLVKECRQQGLQPQMLAFALIYFVWPAEEQKKLPTRDSLDKGTALLAKAARWLSQHGKEGLSLPGVDEVTTRLRQYATTLHQEIIPVSIGNFAVAERPFSRRDRGKRRAVFFLTGCAQERGTARKPWALITGFLVLCGLVPRTTKPKTVATWWSNCLERDRKQSGRPDTWESELEEHQEGFYEWFRTMNQEVEQSWSRTKSPQ
jgi:hypothetical protein